MTPPTARAIKPHNLSPPSHRFKETQTTHHPRISPKTAQKPKPNMQLTRKKGTKPTKPKQNKNPPV
jgi:hypothetical protein